MATYIELQQQIEALQKEAQALKEKERQGVIDRMKEAIAVYDITAADLGLRKPRGRTASIGSKPARAAKTSGRSQQRKGKAYADSQGNTWGGRGPRPRWLREALDKGAK